MLKGAVNNLLDRDHGVMMMIMMLLIIMMMLVIMVMTIMTIMTKLNMGSELKDAVRNNFLDCEHGGEAEDENHHLIVDTNKWRELSH